MKHERKIDVKMNGSSVGTLAETSDGRIAFQYSGEWLKEGFSISPLSIPLKNDVFTSDSPYFDGLFGVFDDSLPDGWGRLLLDRRLKQEGIDTTSITALDRLSFLMDNGMGALEYYPRNYEPGSDGVMNIDKMGEESAIIYDSENSDAIDAIYIAGGSSGGARPKANVLINGEPWIVKFPTSFESSDIGIMEKAYNDCAKNCGIDVAESMIVPSKRCEGYFASKRFDRETNADESIKKVHMVSAGGLLESSHRFPALDYNDIIKLVMYLTRDITQAEELFRRMCFNVFAHNRDDHSKNFAFVYDDENGEWRLSPAYDLTYSISLNGEHATMVNGNGNDPSEEDMMEVAKNAGLSPAWAKAEMDKIYGAVHDNLGSWMKP